jgi:CO/xanthine dehydrogenase Mo-binding subunit
MLGFTTRDHIRLIWGDSDLAPLRDEWFGGRTITLQGAAICFATDKLRKDLLARAANVLATDTAKLKMRDGVISSTDDPKKSTMFAAPPRPTTDHPEGAAAPPAEKERRTRA